MERLQPKLRFPEFKDDWDKKTIAEICLKKSSSISANKIEENFGEFVIYGASGVLKKIDFYQEENDFVSIVKDGAGVGRLLYCKGKSSVLGTLEIISPKANIDTYFLYSLLSNIDFAKYVMGSTIPHIYFKDYSIEKCGLPCNGEQTKIANFLSVIDEKLNLLIQKKEALEEYKKGMLQKIFSQEIRFKDDNGEDFEEWNIVRLNNVVSQFIVPMRDKPKDLDGDIPWCRIEDFDGKYLSKSKSKQGVSIKTIQQMNLKVYPINTLLVSCSANLGFCAIVQNPLITNQTFIGLVPNEEKINVEFLYFIMKLSAQRLNVLSSGTTISYLSREQFEKFEINIPKLNEQTKIASFLSAIDDKIELVSTQIEETKEYKKGLLQGMFC